MEIVTVKLESTKTYLLSYTIFNGNNLDNKFRKDIKNYLDTLNGEQMFETTYLIESELPCKKLCNKIKLQFNILLEENNLINKVDVKLGIFEIINENSYISTL